MARLVVAGLVALALLALGEAAPAAWPVVVAVEAHGPALRVDVDGATHELTSSLADRWLAIGLDQPGPLEREYQIDGSDTTANSDRQPGVIVALLGNPLYRLNAWLRDEGSFSRWERVRVLDLSSGQALDLPLIDVADVSKRRTLVQFEGGAPRDFRLEAVLRRPEAAAHVWLIGGTLGEQEGLELDRDRRNARWLVQRQGLTQALPRWFFPEQPMPFVADLLHLVGRSAMAGCALALVALALARVSPIRELPGLSRHVRWPALAEVLIAGWLLAAALVTAGVYHQLPHILDAVSYTFQAHVFRAGRLWLDPPAIEGALRGPFQVIVNEHWFSQYPPGAAAAYAVGGLVGIDWLIGSIACASLIAATTWVATTLYGRNTGLVVLVLGVMSPFILFQAGSFLSHPIAAGFLAGALAAVVKAERDPRPRWYAVAGTLLGAAFLTREAASVLFALPLGLRLILTRRWAALGWVVALGLPWLAIYLAYNAALAGSPLVLPRSLFNPSDRFGFGDNIGFHQRHTLAAGLVNTDELLTVLQFDLFGWPALFALGLIGLPFLVGRARAWDTIALLGVLAFVVAYAAYFYHGIALGPRYYFEAMPWLLLLAGRGAQVMAHVAQSRLVVGVVLGALILNTALFYLPAELSRRADYSALPDARPLSLSFVQSTALGPRLVGVPAPALVVTADWWLFNTSLAALNCPRVPDCDVLFALATTPEDAARLRSVYPGRQTLHTVDRGGRIELVPD